ncbi:hypothetical protein [Pandoraea sputorum]|uniref:hypothetical protein n=1 Tax=Pandoraea sputorum TaxID=93222 RepID=UPI002AF6B2B6|nr:hypothetical protein [Pandoraea sputorum]
MGDGTGALTSGALSDAPRPGPDDEASEDEDDEDDEGDEGDEDAAAIDGLSATGTDIADMIGSSFMVSSQGTGLG